MDISQDVLPKMSPYVAVLPWGSLEQHGPHLPLGTDTIIAKWVAEEAVKRLGGKSVVLLPAMNYGSSFEHGRLFHISLGYQSMISIVKDLVRSLSLLGVRHLVIVNGHGGNSSVLNVAQREVNFAERAMTSLLVFSVVDLNTYVGRNEDLHAGDTETSALSYIDRALVKLERIEGIDFSQNCVPFNDKTTGECSPSGVVNGGKRPELILGIENALNKKVDELSDLIRDLLIS